MSRHDVLSLPQVGLRTLRQLSQIVEATDTGTARPREGPAHAEPMSTDGEPELDADFDSEDEFVELVVNSLRSVEPSDRNVDICVARWFGDSTTTSRTLSDIGKEHSLSRERVRQIVERSILRLRRNERPSGHDLKDYVRTVLAIRGPQDYKRAAHYLSNGPDLRPSVGARLLATLITTNDEERRATEAEILTSFETHLRSLFQRKQLSWLADLLSPSSPQDTRECGIPLPSGPGRNAEEPDWTSHSTKLGRAVVVDSTYEARLVALFDQHPDVVRFCEQPYPIPYDHQGRSRNYWPDFDVEFASGARVLLECKPALHMAQAINRAKWNAAHRWAAERGLSFVVVDPVLRTSHADLVRRDLDSAMIERVELVPSQALYTSHREFDLSRRDAAALLIRRRADVSPVYVRRSRTT